MHYTDEREFKSKIYLPNMQSITINKDMEHQVVNEREVLEPKHIQEKKKIDKIMQNIVKERMFGTFLKEDTKISV